MRHVSSHPYRGDFPIQAENIEKLTLANMAYRKVHKTFQYSQVVLMTLQPEEDIPWEIHTDVDQFIRVEKGLGVVQIKNNVYEVENAFLEDGSWFTIGAGQDHRVANMSKHLNLHLYVVYCGKPAHKIGTFQKRQHDTMYLCE
jgi:mannose-6-phosphate isomerase-like protein (cupin superfamily)